MQLEDIIKNADGAVFNNAAQVWNHTFYWNSMTPKSEGIPKGALLDAINKSFGSADVFKEKFTSSAMSVFGSGWVWLVKKTDGSLDIKITPNAENPLKTGDNPLFTCDIWEHAYYIDYRNDRAKYIENFWKLINWKFASDNFGK
jgi:Fe-Mn family superoxide dismutase